MSKEINAQKYIKEYESDKVVARHVFPLTLEDYMKDQTECYIKYLSPKDMPYDGYRELRIKPLGENPAETISKESDTGRGRFRHLIIISYTKLSKKMIGGL